MTIPLVTNGFQGPSCVYRHDLWGASQSDIASNVTIQDGDIIVYRLYGNHPSKFNPTGSNNLALGAFTSDGDGTANIMIGYNAGSVYDSSVGTVTCAVSGSDNVLIGSSAGSIQINGGYNTGIGYKALMNSGMTVTALGSLAGTESTESVQSASNCIYINASGNYLHSTEPGGCYIKPIRASSNVTGKHTVYYDANTGELVYHTS